ncbi:MAG: hypothetical protein Q9160_002615 [Pyrenula sp. 1 TL-2023]
MLHDPYQQKAHGTVKRIVGNVGKPGMAILIPPFTTEVPRPREESWRVINHSPFDGQYEDHFATTSLHLHFTGYELPIDVGERGKIDHPAYLLETVVSAYDRGQRIADVDLLKGLSQCKHGWGDSVSAENAIQSDLVAIDNWCELLDPPMQRSIVRAWCNPFARLAIVAIAAQRGYNFRVIDPKSENLPRYDPKTKLSPDVDIRPFSEKPQESPKFENLPDFIEATIQRDMFGGLYDVDLASESSSSETSFNASTSSVHTSSPSLNSPQENRLSTASPSPVGQRSPSEGAECHARFRHSIMYIC